MKLDWLDWLKTLARSLPVRGAWIEIPCRCYRRNLRPSLPVRGAWIEIISCIIVGCVASCRSPCGERGLKFHA